MPCVPPTGSIESGGRKQLRRGELNAFDVEKNAGIAATHVSRGVFFSVAYRDVIPRMAFEFWALDTARPEFHAILFSILVRRRSVRRRVLENEA